MGLFKQQSKVKAGKSVSADSSKKEKKSLFASWAQAWKKLDSMDQKKAYTWGAVSVAVIVLLMMLASFASSSREQEDFSDYETRGYDLSRMPFSSDEAEAYLLANKYPDMQEPVEDGLYTPEEKAERQAEDEQELLEKMEQEEAEQESQRSARTSRQNRDRFIGASMTRANSSGTSGGSTKIGKLSSANLKSANGSGINSTFGATGDFSNFKDQNKGREINSNAPLTAGSGNARTALQQMAQASRAAAGLKDDKMLNAKKALMGGNVQGSDAFTDNGGVDLANARGLDLDPNAPFEAGSLEGLGEKLDNAKKEADKKNEDKSDEYTWERLWMDVVKDVIHIAAQSAFSMLQAKVAGTTGTRVDTNSSANTAKQLSDFNDYLNTHSKLDLSNVGSGANSPLNPASSGSSSVGSGTSVGGGTK